MFGPDTLVGTSDACVLDAGQLGDVFFYARRIPAFESRETVVAAGTGHALQQFNGRCLGMRACDSNNCPVGIATQREDLGNRLVIDSAADGLQNYFQAGARLDRERGVASPATLPAASVTGCGDAEHDHVVDAGGDEHGIEEAGEEERDGPHPVRVQQPAPEQHQAAADESQDGRQRVEEPGDAPREAEAPMT